MQTPSISPVANPVPGPGRSQNAASDNGSTTPFNQVLSQEVAQRKNPEARAAESKQGKQDKQAGSENRTQTNAAKPAGEAKQADGKAAAEEGVDKPEEALVVETDAAAQASADLLALVANVAQLQKTDGKTAQPVTEGAEDVPESGRKAASPFAAIQAALIARSGRPAQDKTEALPTQGEGAPTSRADLGKAGNDVLPIQAAVTAQAVAGAGKGAAGATEFSAALKDANQLLQPMQQAAANQAAQAESAQAAGERLAPRVGTSAWDQALGQKIVWMVNGEQQNASLTLNPPELGPLKVVLQISNTQASATFVAAQPEVRQALEAAMPRLRDMLEDAGIQLGQATVDSGSPQHQHASERQTGRGFGLAEAGDSSEPAATVSGARVLSGGGRGLVDTFA